LLVKMSAVSLARLKQLAIQLRRHEEGVAAARAELRDAITEARDQGATLSAIADVLGVSRQRVAQIIREERT